MCEYKYELQINRHRGYIRLDEITRKRTQDRQENKREGPSNRERTASSVLGHPKPSTELVDFPL